MLNAHRNVVPLGLSVGSQPAQPSSREDAEKWIPELYKCFDDFGLEIHKRAPGDTDDGKSVMLFCAAPRSKYVNPRDEAGAADGGNRPGARQLGTIEGYAVGGCCDLSTSTHHLVQRLGVEQGYNLAKESGRDLEEGIACATAGLRRRFAARVWRDYYKHVDARRRYANPTDEGLVAQQRDRQIEEESRRRENEERVAQYNYFAARASNRSAWARAGMG